MLLASISAHKIDVLGTLDVDVRVESAVIRHKLIVCTQSHTDLLLGFHFIDRAADNTHIQYKSGSLVNSETFVIST